MPAYLEGHDLLGNGRRFNYICAHGCGEIMFLTSSGDWPGGSACPIHGATYGTWVPVEYDKDRRARQARTSANGAGRIHIGDTWVRM